MCGALLGNQQNGTKNNPLALPSTGLAYSMVAPKQAAKVNDKVAKVVPLGIGSSLLMGKQNG